MNEAEAVAGVPQNEQNGTGYPEGEHSYEIVVAGEQYMRNVWEQSNDNQWITLTGLEPVLQMRLMQGERVLTPDEESDLVAFLGGLGDMGAWARGDFCLAIRERYKRNQYAENWTYNEYNVKWGEEVRRLASLFGVSERTIYANISTSNLWRFHDRVTGRNVRHKHHEAAQYIPDHDLRKEYMVMAEEEGWTWKILNEIARGRRTPDGQVLIAPQRQPERYKSIGEIEADLDGSIAEGVYSDIEEYQEADLRHLIANVPQLADEQNAYAEQMFRDTDGDMPFAHLAENPFENLTVGAGVPLTPFDEDNLPEGWEQYTPVEIGVPATQWTMNAEAAEGEWVSMSMIDEDGVTTILTEGNEHNQRIHFLFANGTTWEVIAHVALAKIQVRMLNAEIDETHKAYRD